jgi:hypothetical protein
MSEEKGRWLPRRLSDPELLRSIGRDIQHLYYDILREPLPSKIEALVYKQPRAAFAFEWLWLQGQVPALAFRNIGWPLYTCTLSRRP